MRLTLQSVLLVQGVLETRLDRSWRSLDGDLMIGRHLQLHVNDSRAYKPSYD